MWFWDNLEKLSYVATLATVLGGICAYVLTQRQKLKTQKLEIWAEATEVFERVYSDLNSAQAIADRRYIYNSKLTPEQLMASPDRAVADRICVALDRVGVLINNTPGIGKRPLRDGQGKIVGKCKSSSESRRIMKLYFDM